MIGKGMGLLERSDTPGNQMEYINARMSQRASSARCDLGWDAKGK